MRLSKPFKELLFLAVFFLTTSVIGVMNPDSESCRSLFQKVYVKPLRPVGSSAEEPFFHLMDDVAKEFQGKPELISPVDWRKKTAASGLPGLDLPKELGGKGFSPSQMIKIFEYAGRYSLNLRDVPGGGHSRVLLFSDEPEHRKILEQVAEGNGYMAIALTEPDIGSNIRGMKTVAKKVQGGYELTGHKKYNARYSTASHIILFTQAPNQNGKNGKLNAFCLPKDFPGLKFEEMPAAGLKGNSFGGVSFDKLFVPEKFRVGQDGEGGKIFRQHFTYWRLMQTAAALGTAKRALEMTADRLRTREVNGKKIGSMTHLQQQLAEHSIQLESLTAFVEKAARLLDSGDYEEGSRLAGAAKARGVEAAHQAVDFALKTYGAAGYDLSDNDLFSRLADLTGLRIADGMTDVLQSEYVKKTFGDDFWDMAFGD
jgi:alkylation response protein AidB-like acyl-CoA dehydrogenase